MKRTREVEGAAAAAAQQGSSLPGSATYKRKHQQQKLRQFKPKEQQGKVPLHRAEQKRQQQKQQQKQQYYCSGVEMRTLASCDKEGSSSDSSSNSSSTCSSSTSRRVASSSRTGSGVVVARRHGAGAAAAGEGAREGGRAAALNLRVAEGRTAAPAYEGNGKRPAAGSGTVRAAAGERGQEEQRRPAEAAATAMFGRSRSTAAGRLEEEGAAGAETREAVARGTAGGGAAAAREAAPAGEAAAGEADEDGWSLSEGCLDGAIEQESSSFSLSEEEEAEEAEEEEKEEKSACGGKREKRDDAEEDAHAGKQKRRRVDTTPAATAATAAAGRRRKEGRGRAGEDEGTAAVAKRRATAGKGEENEREAAAARGDGRRNSSSSEKKSSSSSALNVLLDTQTPWGNLGLSRPLLKAVEGLKFDYPTRVQSACIRPALQGRDILGSAPTGSGKTAAFLLPTLERLLQSPGVRARTSSGTGDRKVSAGGLRGTKVLLLLPTRELALQSFHVLQQLSKYTPITHALACGGMTLKEQEAALRQQPDVVVATPGRILDLLLNSPSVHLELLEIVIMDEADRLLELGFREEILEILRHCHRAHQTLLFSATLTPSIAALASLALKTPLHVSAWGANAPDEGEETATTRARPVVVPGAVSGRRRRAAAAAAAAAALKTVAPSLEQQFVALQQETHRLPALLHLCLSPFFKNKKLIIFFSTKQLAHETFLLFKVLGLKAAELHGNLTQQMRIDALHRFHSGEVSLLLASELASRGLDIAAVDVVINFHVPQDIDRYIHSAGRTARMGRTGIAVTLYNNSTAERLQVKQLLHALRGSDNSGSRKAAKERGPAAAAEKAAAAGAGTAGGGGGEGGRVLRRKIENDKLLSWAKKISSVQKEVKNLLKKERLEREMRLADLQLQKAENMQLHADEIYARPMRQWFMSNREKQQLKQVSKSAAAAGDRRQEEEEEATAAETTKPAKKRRTKEEEEEEKEYGEKGLGRQDRAAEGSDSDSESEEENLPSWISACSDDEAEGSSEEEEQSEEEEEEEKGEEEDSVARGSAVQQRQTQQSQSSGNSRTGEEAGTAATAAKKTEKNTHRKLATSLSVKQRERMEELRLMKVAGKAVKKAQQQRRMRYDSAVDDEPLLRGDTAKGQSKFMKKKKKRRQGPAAAAAQAGREEGEPAGGRGVAAGATGGRSSSSGRRRTATAWPPAAKKSRRTADVGRLKMGRAAGRGMTTEGTGAARKGGEERNRRRSRKVVASKKGFKSKGRYKRRR